MKQKTGIGYQNYAENPEETIENAHRQIAERKYEAVFTARGIAPERIRKYGFVFRGKECLIG